MKILTYFKLCLSIFINIILITNCNQEQNFVIKGKVVNGELDSAKVYLLRTLQTIDYSPELMDSSLIINNQFQFEGNLKTPQPYLITGFFNGGKRLYEFIFIESGTYNLTFDVSQNDLIAYDSTKYDKLKLDFYINRPRLNTNAIYGKIVDAKQNEDQKSVDSLQHVLIDYNKKIQDYYYQFFKNHSTSPVSSYLLAELNHDLDQEVLIRTFELLDGEALNSPFIPYLRNNISKIKNTRIGKIAPNIALKDLNGKIKSLREYEGNYIVLDFWALWCGPCRKENREVFAPAYEKYRNENFEIFSVSLDRKTNGMKKKIQEGIQHDNISWVNVWDRKAFQGETVEKYYITKLPTNLLLDPNQKIIALDIRGDSLKTRLNNIFGY